MINFNACFILKKKSNSANLFETQHTHEYIYVIFAHVICRSSRDFSICWLLLSFSSTSVF